MIWAEISILDVDKQKYGASLPETINFKCGYRKKMNLLKISRFPGFPILFNITPIFHNVSLIFH